MSKAKMHVNAHEADNDLQFLSYNQVTKLGYVQKRVLSNTQIDDKKPFLLLERAFFVLPICLRCH